jgi:dihydroflavonol-4-reductase
VKVLVTGATGFIGGNLARALVARGYEVRALARPRSSTLTLENTRAEIVQGDLGDRDSLSRALKGCQGLFHCAALYTFWSRDPREVYKVNVDGTRALLAEGLASGVKKVVYTSTVSTIGLPKGSQGTEDMEPTWKDLKGHYKRSKWLGEQEALKANSTGLPVVVVNPTAPVGPWDVKPTPTGGIIRDFLRRRLPAYVNTGMNLVDVEDVAIGHILAMEKGQPGQRYILGHKNTTLKEMLTLLESITGLKAPWLRAPLRPLIGLAWLDYWAEGRLLRRQPMLPLEGLQVARKPMYVSSEKAVRELGMPQSPIGEALGKAVRWFKEYGGV